MLGGHVAITGGQFNRVYLASDSADLSVTGGTFARIAYSGEDTSRTPLFFPAEGYTFQKADGSYANTGDVVMEENLRYLEDVTVTTPPFTITRYPVDTDLYPTTPVGYRPDFVTEVTFHIPESSPTIEFQWYQVGDPRPDQELRQCSGLAEPLHPLYLHRRAGPVLRHLLLQGLFRPHRRSDSTGADL